MRQRHYPTVHNGSSSHQRPWRIISWLLGSICLFTISYTFYSSRSNTKRFPRPGVEDLGEEVEGRYHLLGTRMDEYIRTLAEFTTTSFPPELSSDIIQSLPGYLVHFDHRKSYKPAIASFPTIHQPSTIAPPVSKHESYHNWTRATEDDGWARISYDDQAISEWFERLFKRRRGGDIGLRQVWEPLEASERRAVLFKYLVILLDGGTYIDDKTYPIRPISHWGKARPEIYDISSTDKTIWRRVVETTGPSVVLLIDVDIHKKPDLNQTSRSRPLELSTRVFSAAPHHPILIDTFRRIINLAGNPTGRIRSDVSDRSSDGREIRSEQQDDRVSDDKFLKEEVGSSTGGPLSDDSGVLTDSALSYLLARYSVRWHDLRGIDRPMRIGEVLLLPTSAIIREELFVKDIAVNEQAVVMYGPG